MLALGLCCAALPAVSRQQEKTPPSPLPGVKLVAEIPAPAPPPPFHFPASDTRTLPNGLRVFVISARAGTGAAAAQPAVSVEMLIRDAGAVSDPAGKSGVASLTADLLRQGTEKRSAEEIAGAIDFVGGTLTANVGRDATTIRSSVVKKDFALAMDLFSDIILHPKFEPEEIERQRQQLLSGLEVQYSDANYLASAVFRRVVFGASPYGLPTEGTPASAGALTRDDLVAFHERAYGPDHALLAFAGDITPEEAFAAAEKYFGSWPANHSVAEITLPQRPKGMRIYVVDKPDAVQTQIRIGRLGIPRAHGDSIPLEVTNQIFGGSYNSRLNTSVRLKKGLTYDASADFASYLRTGVFEASTFTRTEATVDATKLVLDEIARMAGGDVTSEELNVARDFLAGVFTIAIETPAQVADSVATAAFYNLPADYNQTYPDKVRAITAEQVRQMARRYFDAADLDLVLVGKAAAFRDALKQAFPQAEYHEIPEGNLDLLAPTLQRATAAAAGAGR